MAAVVAAAVEAVAILVVDMVVVVVVVGVEEGANGSTALPEVFDDVELAAGDICFMRSFCCGGK